METITFAGLSAAACVFLTYVFANFHRELERLKKTSAAGSQLVRIGAQEAKPSLTGTRPAVLANAKRQANQEAFTRREILIG